MLIEKAKKFVKDNARPLELAIYNCFFEQGSRSRVIEELSIYQNQDGGFGHGLEADNWNPNSNPIATNDAIITLFKVNALNEADDMIQGIVNYLRSKDSFDNVKRRWLFSIDSNKDHPHAIWWEKRDDSDGISGFNPTVSLAAFMICYGDEKQFYEDILKSAFEYLKENDEVSGDELKCFMLSYELLRKKEIDNIVNLDELKSIIIRRIESCICKEPEKYGVEYVPVPSDFFCGVYNEFISDEIEKLIDVEKSVLERIQKEDGGFDISWQWYTECSEFEQSRKWWRPRITIDKLKFYNQDYKINRIIM